MSGGESPFEAAPENPRHASRCTEHVEANAAAEAEGTDESSPDEPTIDGADILERVHEYLLRFAAYPSPQAARAHTLWIAQTHFMEAWFTNGRLAILSPEPGSGKSRILELTGCLVPRPIFTVMASSAFIMRRIADQKNRPTILLDEADAIFGPKAGGCETLRAILNAGYRYGATVGRCYTEKGKVLTEELPTYAAVAMVGLGDLPDTIMSRSIVVRMRKRLPHEVVTG